MKCKYRLLVVSALLSVAFASLGKNVSSPVFREPFTLTLHIDKERYYEESFKSIPYTHDRDIYLFKGEHLGVVFGADGVPIYEPDLKKADVELAFSQDVKDDGTVMMLLTLSNHTSKTLHFKGLMTMPGKDGIFQTSILPIGPGLTNFESWPGNPPAN